MFEIRKHGPDGRLLPFNEWGRPDATRELAREVRQLRRTIENQRTTTPSSANKPAPLTEREIGVLAVLAEYPSRLFDQNTISARAMVRKATVSDDLKRLRSLGLTHRPKGKRSGEGITARGLEQYRLYEIRT